MIRKKRKLLRGAIPKPKLYWPKKLMKLKIAPVPSLRVRIPKVRVQKRRATVVVRGQPSISRPMSERKMKQLLRRKIAPPSPAWWERVAPPRW